MSHGSEKNVKTVRITRGDGGPLDPKLVPSKIEGVNAVLKEIKAGEDYELTVTLTPPIKSQRLRGKLELETGLAKAPKISIPIVASQPPRVVATPRRFIIPREVPADWEQTVTVTWNDNLPYKIADATIDDPTVKLRVDETGNTHKVVLQLPEGYSPRRGAQTVRISTNDPETPFLSVPITVASAHRRGIESRFAPPRLQKPERVKPAAKPELKTPTEQQKEAAPVNQIPPIRETSPEEKHSKFRSDHKREGKSSKAKEKTAPQKP